MRRLAPRIRAGGISLRSGKLTAIKRELVYYIPESIIEKHVQLKEITCAVESMYKAIANDRAQNFPVVREQLGYADAIFGFKSGFDSTGPLLGVKAGGYWPGNGGRGITNHQSTVVLFDPDTGQAKALVAGNRLTALRTAAASAVSIKYLARSDASVLGILGAGAQSFLQVRAALDTRPFTRLLIVDRVPEQAAALAAEFADLDIDVSCTSAETMTTSSDVIITVTPSFKPVIKADWVRPGTHFACMGTDTRGKQELESRLFSTATVFCDERVQAITIGECQHPFNDGLIRESDIIPIGKVISGDHPGRAKNEEVTIFDSTGVGLQDVVAANAALEIALGLGLAQILD